MKCNEDDECNITELQQEQETTEQLQRKLMSPQERSCKKKVDPVILFIKEMQFILSHVQDKAAEFLKVRMH